MEKKKTKIRHKLIYPDGKEKVVDLGENQNESQFMRYCADLGVGVDRVVE